MKNQSIFFAYTEFMEELNKKSGTDTIAADTNKKVKKNRKDRRDGRWVKEADPMHKYMPYILPNRADNEASLCETFDMTEVLKYLKEKNATIEEGGFKYTLFHVITAALTKVMYFRPKLNYFIQGHRLYERYDISYAFTIKKRFVDNAEEGLCIIKVGKPGTVPINELYGKIKERVTTIRHHNKTDGTTDIMAKLVKMPRWLIRFVTKILRFWDYHGITPKSLSKDDPYYTSVFISNLGSIKMRADYHHLANYGTNSFFLIINEMKKTPVFNEDGTYEMKNTLDMAFTIDERIADGVYFGNSIKLLKKVLQNPWMLDRPVETPIEEL